MRRDYFTCVVLLYIAASLSFVCLFPVYYEYGQIVTREISFLEQMFSIVCVLVAVVFVPVISSLNKRKWIMIGSCAYGLLAYLPEMILSKMDASLSGAGANTFAVIEAFFLRAIYSMVNAPYAGVSTFVGDKVALTLPKLILPVSLICYIIVQLFRFYRNAYIAEQMNPVSTHRTSENTTSTRKPEILGTVISAPVGTANPPDSATTVVPTVNPTPKPQQPKPVQQAQQPKQPAASLEQNKKIPLSESKVADNNSGKKAPAIPENTNPSVRNSNVIYVAPSPAPAKAAGDETKVIPLPAPAKASSSQSAKQNSAPVIYASAPSNPVQTPVQTAPVRVAPAPAPVQQTVKPVQQPVQQSVPVQGQGRVQPNPHQAQSVKPVQQPYPQQPQQPQQTQQPAKPRTPRRSAPIVIQQDGPNPNTPPKGND